MAGMAIAFSFTCCANKENTTETVQEQPKDRIQLVADSANRRVDVLADGALMTAYIYPETIKKPVLYPLTTVNGTKITRGFPLEQIAGERVDHPHHVGMWLNYGDVNGLDFWNNSEAIPAEKRDGYGTIVHKEVLKAQGGHDSGTLEVLMHWLAPDGTVLLEERTQFIFSQQDSANIIDRMTTLTAQDQPVLFTDNKEGALGIRVTRALEHPSDKPEIFTDASGNPTDVPTLNNDGVTGRYYSSAGHEGDDVWGTRADWVNLAGVVDGETVNLVILDHPGNVGYPTYWHARGYGLFAANPLGQKALSDGKEELNFSLQSGESTTFKYRVIIATGDKLKAEPLHAAFQDFSKQ